MMTAFLLKCNRFMITGTFRLPPNPEAFLNREAFVQLGTVRGQGCAAFG